MKLSSIINEIEAGWLSELDVPMPTAPAPGATPVTDPQAQAKLQAQQVKQLADQKKQIQDAIRRKQQEIQDLQKQLS